MKIQIVNNQDELIDTKERYDLDYSIDTYRVSALWITNSKGQSLLAQRASTKSSDPGKWGPAVAGTIEEGETYEQNIYKEAVEEIGLEDVKFSKSIKMRFDTNSRKYFCQWYIVEINNDIDSFTRQVEEVDALEWVDTHKLKEDLKANPDKYVPGMEQIVEELGL